MHQRAALKLKRCDDPLVPIPSGSPKEQECVANGRMSKRVENPRGEISREKLASDRTAGPPGGRPGRRQYRCLQDAAGRMHAKETHTSAGRQSRARIRAAAQHARMQRVGMRVGGCPRREGSSVTGKSTAHGTHTEMHLLDAEQGGHTSRRPNAGGSKRDTMPPAHSRHHAGLQAVTAAHAQDQI